MMAPESRHWASAVARSGAWSGLPSWLLRRSPDWAWPGCQINGHGRFRVPNQFGFLCLASADDIRKETEDGEGVLCVWCGVLRTIGAVFHRRGPI